SGDDQSNIVDNHNCSFRSSMLLLATDVPAILIINGARAAQAGTRYALMIDDCRINLSFNGEGMEHEMSKKMKLLIAYDGSESADQCFEGLPSAGFPAEAEAVVLSVAELTFPPPPVYGVVADDLTAGFPYDLEKSKKLAEKARDRV